MNQNYKKNKYYAEIADIVWELPIVERQNIFSGQMYPIDVLPTVFKDAAKCIHEKIQVPLAMAANSILFAMTFIAQKYVNACDIHRNLMPCSLFFLTEAESGDRKSTTDNFALKVINEEQKRQTKNYKNDYKVWECIPQKERQNISQPHNPKRIFSNTTLEPIVGGFIRGEYTNIAISSNDGADFLCGHSMTSETSKSNMALLTKIFDNGSIDRNRAKGNTEGSGEAFDKRLSMHLMIQPFITEEVLSNQAMANIGLLPRCIFVAPQSLAGS